MALAIVFDSFFNGCLASEARQAEGIGRGAVVKPRTPQGLSTGLSCGQVACPARARSGADYAAVAIRVAASCSR